jgi:lipopolysaccharide transport system permease protein
MNTTTTELPSTAGRWEITNDVPGTIGTIKEIWTHRRLLNFIARRSVKKIYRRTLLGWLWLFIIPLFPIALRTLIFGALIGVTSEGIPYFLFLMVGQLLWDVFAVSLMWGTRGIELHGGVQDVYVPRVLMPLGAMAPAGLDLLIKTGVLILATTYFWFRDGRMYIVLSPALLLAAAALLLTITFALALTLFTSTWAIGTRDARFAVGQVTAIWYLLTPVLYPMSSVPESWRSWMFLNPLAAIINAFKYGVLGIGEPDMRALLVATLVVMMIFTIAIRYFARHDAAANDAR